MKASEFITCSFRTTSEKYSFLHLFYFKKDEQCFKYLIFICWFTECIDFLMLKLMKDQVSPFKFSASNLGNFVVLLWHCCYKKIVA